MINIMHGLSHGYAFSLGFEVVNKSVVDDHGNEIVPVDSYRSETIPLKDRFTIGIAIKGVAGLILLSSYGLFKESQSNSYLLASLTSIGYQSTIRGYNKSNLLTKVIDISQFVMLEYFILSGPLTIARSVGAVGIICLKLVTIYWKPFYGTPADTHISPPFMAAELVSPLEEN